MENCGDHEGSCNTDSLFRVKVVVLGPSQSGKSSLIQSLLENSPTAVETPTEGVDVDLWTPFQLQNLQHLIPNRSLTEEEKTLVLELWDTTGRQVCQAVHGLFITPSTVCVIVYDVTDGAAAEKVLSLYRMVQQKCLGSPVIIVENKADQLNSSSSTGESQARERIVQVCQKYNEGWKQEVQREIDNIKAFIKEMSSKENDNDEAQERQAKKETKNSKPTDNPFETLPRKRLSDLEQLLKRNGRNASLAAHTVSVLSDKGLDDVRRLLLQTALNSENFPLRKKFIRPSVAALHDQILAMRDRDLVLLPWQQFHDLVVQSRGDKKQSLEEEIAFLESVGVLMDIRLGHVTFPPPSPNQAQIVKENAASPLRDTTRNETSSSQDERGHKMEEERYICAYPAVLAAATCCCLIDDDKKAFRFEAGRFWPRDSGFKHPDPHMLCRLLEAIPQQGLLREGLLPLLWQEYPLQEDQVLSMLHVLQGVGVMALHSEQKKYCEGMALPAFPSLSVKRCHALPLLNLLPDNRPQLNWTAKPFAGDMQITWRFSMAVAVHAGLVQRLLAMVVFLARNCSSYTHIWKTGVLLRVGEATVCAEQASEGRVDLACRVNGDEVGREAEAMRMLWVTLAPFLQHVRAFLYSWSGIQIREMVVALGQQFYLEEQVEREPELWVVQVLALWQRQTKFSFTDGDTERQLDIRLMMPFKPDKTVTSLDSWLQLVVSHTEEALRETSQHVNNEPPALTQVKDGFVRGINRASLKNGMNRGSLKLQKKKKSVEVKWQLQEDKNNNTTTAPTATTTTTTPGNQPPSKDSNTTTPATPATNGGNIADDKKAAPNGRVVSEEEERAEATRLASGFVAAILATAVADYIAQEAESDQDGRKMVSAAQITAARVTAEAALAVQTGNIDGAANAVIDAVNSVHANSVAKSDVKVFKDGRPQSKLCILL